jgi:hypothetical protein
MVGLKSLLAENHDTGPKRSGMSFARIETIELVARVPHPLGWLVQELPPGREKSARDTAG